MVKSILVTSTELMMIQFLVPHIIHLSQNGFEVEIACSNVGGRIDEVREKLKDWTKAIHVVRLHRSPANIDNVNGYKDLCRIIEREHYDIIWTNEPVMGVVTRLAAQKARKSGTKVLYMTHGFHFYDGAPKLNWMLYYPIEKMMASRADVICTINREDYRRAQLFNTNRVEYIHGIGINTDRLTPKGGPGNIREELGLNAEDFLVLSVGELNVNKNHQVILRAIAKLNDKNIHYILCGKGDQREFLEKLAEELGIRERVHFLGYRKDVFDICKQTNVFAFPSIREGLGLAALEAMYIGIPLVTSNSRGPVDFMENGKTGYIVDTDDIMGYSVAIHKLLTDKTICEKMSEYNREKSRLYGLENIKKEILELIISCN